MKKIVVTGKGEVRVIETPTPARQANEVLIRVSRSIISAGTDFTLITNSGGGSLLHKIISSPQLVRRFNDAVLEEGVFGALRGAERKLSQLNALGYTLAGTVVESAESDSSYLPSARVCAVGQEYAHHAEFVSVPSQYVFLIPDNVADEDASFAALASIALHGLRQAELSHGETLCVIGLGLLGQLVVRLAHAFGLSVYGFDPNPQMCGYALAAGAKAAMDPADPTAIGLISVGTEGIGADGVIVTAGGTSDEPLNFAMEVAADRATIVTLGHTSVVVRNPAYYRKELRIVASRAYGPGRYDPAYEKLGHDYPVGYVRWTVRRNILLILNMLARRQIRFVDLVTHRLAITDGEDAYETIMNEKNRVAVMLEYPANAHVSRTIRYPHSKSIPEADNNKIRVGYIGTGNFSCTTLLPQFRANGAFSLRLLASTDGVRASQVAGQFSIPLFTTDFNELIQNPDLKLICVANRHSQHAPLVVEALRHGKHVFVEKPLAINREQLDAVVNAARETGNAVFVGLNRSFSPLGRQFKALLSRIPGPIQLLYRINTQANKGWFGEKSEGGAFIGEFSHFVDFVAWALGGKDMENIEGFAGHRLNPEENLSVFARFEGGHTCTFLFTTSGNNKHSKEYIEAFGNQIVVQLIDFRKLTARGLGEDIDLELKRPDKGYSEEINVLAKLLQNGNVEDYPDVIRGANALEASLQAIESLKRLR